MRAHLLSNVTMQPLVPHLRCGPVTVGAYDSLLLELADDGSTAAAPETTHVLCAFDTDALLGDALYDPAAPSRAEAYLDALDAFCARRRDKVVVSTTFCAGSARVMNFADAVQAQSVRAREAALNERLAAMARERGNLVLVDVGLLMRRYGEERLTSPAFWYAGRIRYTNLMFRALGDAISGALDAYANRARKVLVLDLDNTLWGGIVGELGPTGIALSEEGRGACYRDFQRALKGLERTGVLLAICSKNNPEDVDEVFDRNTMMVLRRDDFVCIRANWLSKPENLIDIAETLNLGLDAFVFVDDNPVEREIVAEALPGVATPAFPERPELLPQWLVRDVIVPYFGKYGRTAEDAGKTGQYRANEARRQFAAGYSLDGFLAELQIDFTVRVDDPATVPRASQMTQKTNQFNLTTKRCEPPEVEAYLTDPQRALVTLDYADRFGSEGTVALAMLDLAAGRIDNLLMSCRVIGRKVEDRLLERCFALFRERGIETAIGEFVPSRKNQLVATFYDAHGFHVAAEDETGRRVYERTLA